MTTSTAMDINTFCALPTHISSIFDGSGTEWFVIDNQLRELLDILDGFANHELLEPRDCAFALLEKDGGMNDELELVSEPGLYMLLLMSEAQPVQPFKSWVLDTVAPTLAEDGLFLLGEERSWPAPRGYNFTHDTIWDISASGPSSAIDLSRVFIPALRKNEVAGPHSCHCKKEAA